MNRAQTDDLRKDPREAGERPGGVIPTAEMGNVMGKIQGRTLVMSSNTPDAANVKRGLKFSRKSVKARVALQTMGFMKMEGTNS